MWELDYKESWAPKNWRFWTVVLGRTLESTSDCKEFQPVHPKGNQSWTFIGRTDAEAEALILWPPEGRTDCFQKTLILGKIEGRMRWGRQRMRRLDGITDSMDISLNNMGIYFFCWVMQVFELTILNVNYKTVSSIIFRWRMPKNLVGQQSQ